MKKGLIILIVCFFLLVTAPFVIRPFFDQKMRIIEKDFPILGMVQDKIRDILSVQVAVDHYVVFKTEKTIYEPYEEVVFELGLINKKTGRISSNLKPEITIYDREGKALSNIIDQRNFVMTFDTNQYIYQYRLLLKNPMLEGEIIAVAHFREELLDRIQYYTNSFIVKRRSSFFPLPNRYVFLGLEAKELLLSRSILSPQRKETNFQHIVDWLPILNSDGVIIPAAITRTYTKTKSVWDQQKLEESKDLARLFSQEGQDVALLIQALRIDGLDIDSYPYRLFEVQDGEAGKKYAISIRDDTRKEQLKTVLDDLLQDENVHYLGLSHVFFEESPEELQQEFSNAYPTHYEDKKIFRQWKNYQEVQYYRELFQQVDREKALFYQFSGKELSQNPEFLDMAFASGIDFVFIDLDVSVDNLETQLKLIDSYRGIENYQETLVLSYCLNYNNLIKGQSSAINNWIDQNLSLYDHYGSKAIKVQGLYEAMFGNRGPYPAYEWTLAVGDLIGTWKQSRRSYPLAQNYLTEQNEIADQLTITIELKNISLYPIQSLKVEMMPLVESSEKLLIEKPILEAGGSIRTNIVLQEVQFKESLLQKRTRFLAFRSSFSQEDKGFTNTTQVRLLSFIDPRVEGDQQLSTEDEFNEQIRKERELEALKLEEERKRLIRLSNELARQRANEVLEAEAAQKELELQDEE